LSNDIDFLLMPPGFVRTPPGTDPPRGRKQQKGNRCPDTKEKAGKHDPMHFVCLKKDSTARPDHDWKEPIVREYLSDACGYRSLAVPYGISPSCIV